MLEFVSYDWLCMMITLWNDQCYHPHTQTFCPPNTHPVCFLQSVWTFQCLHLCPSLDLVSICWLVWNKSRYDPYCMHRLLRLSQTLWWTSLGRSLSSLHHLTLPRVMLTPTRRPLSSLSCHLAPTPPWACSSLPMTRDMVATSLTPSPLGRDRWQYRNITLLNAYLKKTYFHKKIWTIFQICMFLKYYTS